MKPAVDTAQFRDAIRSAFKRKDGDKVNNGDFPDGHGMEMVPADDQEVMGESVYKPYTVKNWMGWVYQKQPNGKWSKLVRASNKISGDK